MYRYISNISSVQQKKESLGLINGFSTYMNPFNNVAYELVFILLTVPSMPCFSYVDLFLIGGKWPIIVCYKGATSSTYSN